jgi:hypothetical protein
MMVSGSLHRLTGDLIIRLLQILIRQLADGVLFPATFGADQSENLIRPKGGGVVH